MSALLMVGSFPPMRNSEPGGGQRRDAPRAPTRRLRWPGRRKPPCKDGTEYLGAKAINPGGLGAEPPLGLYRISWLQHWRFQLVSVFSLRIEKWMACRG